MASIQKYSAAYFDAAGGWLRRREKTNRQEVKTFPPPPLPPSSATVLDVCTHVSVCDVRPWWGSEISSENLFDNQENKGGERLWRGLERLKGVGPRSIFARVRQISLHDRFN